MQPEIFKLQDNFVFPPDPIRSLEEHSVFSDFLIRPINQ